jgi:hypothetical protein
MSSFVNERERESRTRLDILLFNGRLARFPGSVGGGLSSQLEENDFYDLSELQWGCR